MIKVIALLLIDEEKVKSNNLDIGQEIDDVDFGDALISEMATVIVSSKGAIAMEDFKVVLNSREEIQTYTGNKGARLKKQEQDKLQELEIVNF